MTGTYVIENKRGEVVRTLNWDSNALSIVYRHDNRRIETCPDTKDLDEDNVPYFLLGEITKSQVKSGPVNIGQVGVVKWLPEIEKLSPSVEVPEDTNDEFATAFKRTSAVMLTLLFLILVIGHFMGNTVNPEDTEQRLVKIVPRPQEQVVEPVVHKKQIKLTRAIPKRYPVHKVSQRNVHRVVHAQHKVSLNAMGALSVLGSSSNKADKDGGLQLNAIHTSKGPGLGGSEGSGGVQTSLYAKGLIAAPLGPNSRAQGAGGYGTHGKGGGEKGYGKIKLAGSSSQYFEPVEREAIIEGGLDREQIAEVIQRHLGQIRFCYEQGLQDRPALSGRVAIRFFINGAGIVSAALISNTSLHAGDVESCIVGRLKSWKFPEPRGGVVVKVTYPFVLKRVSQQS